MYLPIGLLDVSFIVGEAASHDATKDQVKGLRPGPILLEIVELEHAVRWNAASSRLACFSGVYRTREDKQRGLDGAKVDSDYL